MKILMVPLDERPCNFAYPAMMPKTGDTLVLPPKSYMGQKKRPADTAKLAAWVLENGADADACILSLDTLVYGGIVPSRLHETDEETLFARVDVVRELRRRNPRMKLYLFQLIMRCPDYSLSDEEPDYYDLCGKELHLYGRYTHKEKLGILTEEERADFERVKNCIPSDVLADFLGRRKKNIDVLLHDLEMIQDGTADYFIVPQDDAAVYGFTSMDQITVRGFLKSNALHLKTAMYPSADDTGLTLLARAVSELRGVRPKIYVHYASTKAEACIPWFEDRPLGETVKYHILAAGGIQVDSLPEADIVLEINMGSGMWYAGQSGYVTAYDLERNLAELVTHTQYALDAGKIVTVGDVAASNGSDLELLHVLDSAGLLLKLHGYAGWNTSSNTIGTSVCEAVLYFFGRDDVGRKSFLLHRYYEDAGYMAFVRKDVTDRKLPALGLDYFHADGKAGKVAQLVKEGIEAYMRAEFPSLAREVEEVEIEMPWERMFETDVRLKVKA